MIDSKLMKSINENDYNALKYGLIEVFKENESVKSKYEEAGAPLRIFLFDCTCMGALLEDVCDRLYSQVDEEVIFQSLEKIYNEYYGSYDEKDERKDIVGLELFREDLKSTGLNSLKEINNKKSAVPKFRYELK